MSLDDLIKLPLQIQATLAAGYCGYYLANLGLHHERKFSDVLFGTFIYGLPVSLLIGYYSKKTDYAYLSVLIGPIIGLVWHSCARHWFFAALSFCEITTENNAGSVLDTITLNPNLAVTQIQVSLKNGDIYFCKDTRPFNDSPVGTIPIIDYQGNIAFYVTSMKKADEESYEDTESLQDGNGYNLTYFPATEIKNIKLRHLKHKSCVEKIKRKIKLIFLGWRRR